MYVVEFVASVWAKSWSPSSNNDVPFIPSVSVTSASPTSSTLSGSDSNCHSWVEFGISIAESEYVPIMERFSCNLSMPSKYVLLIVSLLKSQIFSSEESTTSSRYTKTVPLILIIVLSLNIICSDNWTS